MTRIEVAIWLGEGQAPLGAGGEEGFSSTYFGDVDLNFRESSIGLHPIFIKAILRALKEGRPVQIEPRLSVSIEEAG